MVVNRRRKVVQHRGGNTNGHGASKKHRGAGSRGGRGNAGTGKRAGQKKAGLKDFKLGRIKGFLRRRGLRRDQTINVGNFTSKTIAKYVEAGDAKKEGSVYVIDLTALGYHKLLGTGKTDLKMKITVGKCSASASEKVKAAGGEVVGASVEEE
ncbi:MAG: uL15m family ribosomal protein [Candidatus Woesearchaeota archaeon]|jgi:large subunit ribosomal protein L15